MFKLVSGDHRWLQKLSRESAKNYANDEFLWLLKL